MSTKGFILLFVTVMAIGGAIGGAFSGGLALGRSQNDDAAPEFAVLQQRFGGGQPSSGGLSGGGFAGGQFSGATANGEAQTGGDAAPIFGGGGFGGRGGPGGGFAPNILNGTVGAVDGNRITVTTDSGETQVVLGDDSTVQTFAAGTVDDLSLGDRIFVIYSGDVESGEQVDALSVVVNQTE